MKHIQRKKLHRSHEAKPLNWAYVLSILTIGAIGIASVFESSVVEGFLQFGDKYHFVKLQITWMAIGLLGFAISSHIPYPVYKKLAQPIFIIAILLLLAVLIPGLGIKVLGARRWINLGFTVLQPSELTKLAVVIYLSSWLSQHQRFWPFAFIVSVVLGLIMLQPDLGTAMIVGMIAFSLYFVSGGSLKKIIVSGLIGSVIAGILIVASPYRLNRVKTFLDPSSDPLGTSYHIRQVLIAIGSGGMTGQGIGKSRQKYQYLPEASTDSIFAIIAEETGFIGSLVVISALYTLVNQGYKIAKNSDDVFAKLLVTGIISWVGFQMLLNLSAMVALVPLTGVPLPLISYGGSSLIMILFALGMVANVSRYAKAETNKVISRRVAN